METAQEFVLSPPLAGLGPMDRPALSDTEQGRRGIELGIVLALQAVFWFAIGIAVGKWL